MSRMYAPAEFRHFASMPSASGWVLRHLLRVEAWLNARAARRVLYHMDERSLADVGITHPDFADRP